MKVVFMGTPDYAVGALEAVIAAGHQVTAVITQQRDADDACKKLCPAI